MAQRKGQEPLVEYAHRPDPEACARALVHVLSLEPKVSEAAKVGSGDGLAARRGKPLPFGRPQRSTKDTR